MFWFTEPETKQILSDFKVGLSISVSIPVRTIVERAAERNGCQLNKVATLKAYQ